METFPIVTVAPRPCSSSARSTASGRGRRNTDCPIQTTPARGVYGTGESGVASIRPKLRRATPEAPKQLIAELTKDSGRRMATVALDASSVTHDSYYIH